MAGMPATGAPALHLLLVRHGKRPHGLHDPELEGFGHQMAHDKAARLAGLPNITAIYSSPFIRAHQTAGPLAAALGLKIRVDWQLCEGLSSFWGLKSDPFPHLRYPKVPQALQDLLDADFVSGPSPVYPEFEGKGEEPGSRDACLARHHAALVSLQRAYEGTGGTIVVFAHGSTHNFLTEAACPGAQDEYHERAWEKLTCVPYCAITTLLLDSNGHWQLEGFGETDAKVVCERVRSEVREVCGDSTVVHNSADVPHGNEFQDEHIHDLRTMWQRPVKPRAVLFLAHGAGHGAEDFFNEKDFAGLPEEQRIVAAALARDFLVISISSSDRERKTWTAADCPKVAHVIHDILQRERLDPQLPVCALGASTGAQFILLLPSFSPDISFTAIVCQIMGVDNRHLENIEITDMPPVLFTHMPRNEVRARVVESNIDFLRARSNIVEERRCHPQAISECFFADRCGIDASISTDMFRALDSGLLIDYDGYLKEDPRRSNWRPILKSCADILRDSLVADRSPIAQAMNVAWGHHEVTSEGIDEALDFCIMHIR